MSFKARLRAEELFVSASDEMCVLPERSMVRECDLGVERTAQACDGCLWRASAMRSDLTETNAAPHRAAAATSATVTSSSSSSSLKRLLARSQPLLRI